MLQPNVQAAVDRLLALFESGDVPRALAHATYPRLKVPSACWSFRNRLLMLLQGTEDARGFRQWREVGRSVKRGAKAIHILAPLYREYIRCPDDDCNLSLPSGGGNCRLRSSGGWRGERCRFVPFLSGVETQNFGTKFK